MLVSAVNKNKNCIGAHGDLLYCQNGKIKRQWKMGNGNIEEGWMPAHPTLLLHREIFNVYGGFKTDYKCAADYEFMVRILKITQINLHMYQKFWCICFMVVQAVMESKPIVFLFLRQVER